MWARRCRSRAQIRIQGNLRFETAVRQCYLSRMSKTTAKITKKDRSGTSAVRRGSKVGNATVMGVAKDGTVIFQPASKPANTTPAKIRAAVRTVKERHRGEELLASR